MRKRTAFTLLRRLLPALLPLASSLSAVDFPGPPPGAARAESEGSCHRLANAALAATFVEASGTLRLDGVDRTAGGRLEGAPDLFRIVFADGDALVSSSMTLTGPVTTATVPPDPASSRAASAHHGKKLEASFRNAAGTLEVHWQAELRDGAGYFRQHLEVASLSGDHAIREIVGLAGEAWDPATSGYTDGPVFIADGFFAALETPVAKPRLETAGAGQEIPVGGWTPALYAPRRMTFPITLPAAGRWDVRFLYSSGNHRLEITRVELLDPHGTVLSFDEHFGFTGHQASGNIYRLEAPAAGSYTIGVDTTYPAAETHSYGSITATPAAAHRLAAAWPRHLTLHAGESWRTSLVTGVHPGGQLRRAFLHYLERERTHPYRQFVHYNSWYDLNIGRNDHPDPFARMTESQTLAVIDAWNRELYTARGVALDGFVWDDGWDDFNSLWDFHAGFPAGFSAIDRRARNQQAGTGAWLSPWGGYGASKARRVAFWNATREPDIAEFHLSHEEYYQAFRNRCLQMLADYDMRYFKFDGIGAGTFATGPAAGNEADIDGLLRLLGELRATRRDVFTNCTVGTWASPFWLLHCDSIWRQGDDAAFEGPGNARERWITYRDNMVYNRFVAGSPLYPLNSLMFHGLIVGNHPGTAPAQMPLDLQSVKNEIRGAMACGSGLQELYVTHGLMTPAMWDELAAGIRWLRANADILVDVHWIGGKPYNPSGGATAVYGWAAWQPRKATLALRNPSAEAKSITLTLAAALELSENASFTVKDGYAGQRALPGFTDALLDAETSVTLQLQPFETLVYDLWPAGAAIPSEPLSTAAAVPATFGAWLAQRGIIPADAPGRRLQDHFNADTDGNGIADGLDFATGGDGGLAVAAGDGHFVIESSSQLPDTSGSVRLLLETSADLLDWEPSTLESIELPGDRLRWLAAPDDSARFFRRRAVLR